VDGPGGESRALADGVGPSEVSGTVDVTGAELREGEQVDAAVVAGGGVEPESHR